MADHDRALTLASAAVMDLISRGQAYQAAVLRGAQADELERMRQEAHDVLDGYLDLSGDAAEAVKAILRR
jgi:hypothetical protein